MVSFRQHVVLLHHVLSLSSSQMRVYLSASCRLNNKFVFNDSPRTNKTLHKQNHPKQPAQNMFQIRWTELKRLVNEWIRSSSSPPEDLEELKGNQKHKHLPEETTHLASCSPPRRRTWSRAAPERCRAAAPPPGRTSRRRSRCTRGRSVPACPWTAAGTSAALWEKKKREREREWERGWTWQSGVCAI